MLGQEGEARRNGCQQAASAKETRAVVEMAGETKDDSAAADGGRAAAAVSPPCAETAHQVTDPNSANVVIIVNPTDFREPGAFPTVTSCIRTSPTCIANEHGASRKVQARALSIAGGPPKVKIC